MPGKLRPIVTFVLLAYLLSCIPYAVILHAHSLSPGGGLITGVLMWMPATAAILTCLWLRIDIASLGWGWPLVSAGTLLVALAMAELASAFPTAGATT